MLLDPLWEGFVRWHSVDTLEHNRAQTRAAIEAALSQLPQAQDKLRAFAELDAA
jgi:outer membrane murein-binding lipoprotein Lpp